VSYTTFLVLDATLALVAALAVFAVFRSGNRLHRDDQRAGTPFPPTPVAPRLALANDEVEDLAEAG